MQVLVHKMADEQRRERRVQRRRRNGQQLVVPTAPAEGDDSEPELD